MAEPTQSALAAHQAANKDFLNLRAVGREAHLIRVWFIIRLPIADRRPEKNVSGATSSEPFRFFILNPRIG